MTYTLSFSFLHEYDLNHTGITIPIVLSLGNIEQAALAKLDTGASFCIFQRELGEALGLNVESGAREMVGTATEPFLVYGHDLTVSALGFDMEATVYFAARQGLPRNVLGRRGWLDKLRLGIIDYEGKLYFSAYEAP
jgi:hypothetical protein